MRDGMRSVRSLGQVKGRQRALAASVDHIVQQIAIAPGAISRLQDPEIGSALDPTSSIARRQFEIDNTLVARMVGVESEKGAAGQLLVRTRPPEGLAAEHRVACGYFKSREHGSS